MPRSFSERYPAHIRRNKRRSEGPKSDLSCCFSLLKLLRESCLQLLKTTKKLHLSVDTSATYNQLRAQEFQLAYPTPANRHLSFSVGHRCQHFWPPKQPQRPLFSPLPLLSLLCCDHAGCYSIESNNLHSITSFLNALFCSASGGGKHSSFSTLLSWCHLSFTD